MKGSMGNNHLEAIGEAERKVKRPGVESWECCLSLSESSWIWSETFGGDAMIVAETDTSNRTEISTIAALYSCSD